MVISCVDPLIGRFAVVVACLESAVGARGGLLEGAATPERPDRRSLGRSARPRRGEDCCEAVEQPKATLPLAVRALEQLYESHGPKTAQLTPVWVIEHAIGGVRAAFPGGWAKNVADSVVFRPGSGIMRLAAMEHDCVAEAQASRTVRSMI